MWKWSMVRSHPVTGEQESVVKGLEKEAFLSVSKTKSRPTFVQRRDHHSKPEEEPTVGRIVYFVVLLG